MSTLNASVAPSAARAGNSMATQWLLNIGHAIDHMFLLIFATAVGSIAGYTVSSYINAMEQAGVMRTQCLAQMRAVLRLEDRDGAHVSSCQKPAQS